MFMRGREGLTNVQNFVHVVFECPLTEIVSEIVPTKEKDLHKVL